MRVLHASYELDELRDYLRNEQFYFGMNKIINQRNQEMKKRGKSITETMKLFSSDTITSTVGRQEKEKDWAIRGGLASGLAGGAAGVATAVNTQIDNQRIRRENAERKQQAEELASALKVASKEAARIYHSTIDWLESTTENDSNLLINIGTSTQELFKCFKIKTKGRRIIIEQSVHEYIDGYLEVCIDKKTYIVPLPFMGVSKSCEGNIYFECNPNFEITSIKPIVLWTIESVNDEENQTTSKNSKHAYTLSDMKDCPAYYGIAHDWEQISGYRTRMLESETNKNSTLKMLHIIWAIIVIIGVICMIRFIPELFWMDIILGFVLWCTGEYIIQTTFAR